MCAYRHFRLLSPASPPSATAVSSRKYEVFLQNVQEDTGCYDKNNDGKEDDDPGFVDVDNRLVRFFFRNSILRQFIKNKRFLLAGSIVYPYRADGNPCICIEDDGGLFLIGSLIGNI